jgi:hypothetical protein
MATEKFETDLLRKSKEFVYEQWRKLLCISVVGEDVSNNQFTPKDVTSEKVRTVFDNGYKLAMLQTLTSLRKELLDAKNSNEKEAIERLIKQVQDRLETQKCLFTYSSSHDKLLYADAVKREAEFLRYAKDDVTKWTDKQM